MNARKLTELDARFTDLRHDEHTCRALVFTCPACDDHAIIVPFAGVSPFPSGSMWRLLGVEDVETAPLEPSINLDIPANRPSPEAIARGAEFCTFHGWVRGGVVTW